MTLDFINVGYGDAILIRSGSFTMLVDCGDWTVGDGGLILSESLPRTSCGRRE